MQNQISPLVLSFGSTDPLGAIGIQADLASFAAMGCHGLSVITAILVADTTEITEIVPLDAELVIDQARTILEDVLVASFKISTLGSVENVSAIAEILSDYPEIPLVFDPFSSAIPDQGEESEEQFLAAYELIIPQTTVLVVSAVDIARLAENWRDEDDESNAADTLINDVQKIIEDGCKYVLVTNTTNNSAEITNCLFDETGMIRNDTWPRLAGSFIGGSATLSGSIAALIANGLPIIDAVLEAQEFTQAALTHSQRFGMGKQIPDRNFWTRENSDDFDVDAIDIKQST